MLSSVEIMMREFIKELDNEYVLELFDKIPKGKRLRAKLILKIAPPNQNTIMLATIIELIHMASLLHDDVIDDATLRRGVSSINALFGDKTAIMLGDILYSKAFSKLPLLDKHIAQIVANSVAMLSVGELLDVELSKKFNPDFKLYFEMIYKKTAILIEAAASSAAILAKKDKDIFALYGKNLGLAFQIVDDILDITQDSKKLGKPSLSDFKEGKTTLPYIYLYKALNDSDKKYLVSLHKQSLDDKDIEWIKQKMHTNSIISKSIKYAKNLAAEALQVIEKEKNDDLELIVKSMIERDF